MTIEIKIFDNSDVRVFEVTGRIDSVTAIKLGEQLRHALNRNISKIVLDLGSVEYLTSAGVREIISAKKAAQVRGGDLRIANPSPRVTEVLTITGLDNELRVFATRDEAVQSFA